jgi:hypothetical protein
VPSSAATAADAVIDNGTIASFGDPATALKRIGPQARRGNARAEALLEAYPVDSGLPRCSVLSDPIGTVARADTDGEGAVARGIPEVVSRRGELRGIFDQAALAGWFCVSWLWKVPRGWAEKPTSFA